VGEGERGVYAMYAKFGVLENLAKLAAELGMWRGWGRLGGWVWGAVRGFTAAAEAT
jgi:hypothetical protein